MLKVLCTRKPIAYKAKSRLLVYFKSNSIIIINIEIIVTEIIACNKNTCIQKKISVIMQLKLKFTHLVFIPFLMCSSFYCFTGQQSWQLHKYWRGLYGDTSTSDVFYQEAYGVDSFFFLLTLEFTMCDFYTFNNMFFHSCSSLIYSCTLHPNLL